MAPDVKGNTAVKLAIQTVLLPGETMEEKFAAAKRGGFDGVEVNTGDVFDIVAKAGEVAAAAAASGLAVAGICTAAQHDPLVPDLADRRRRFAGLAELLRVAEDLGAAGVVSVPIRPPLAYPVGEDSHEVIAAVAVEEFKNFAASLPAGNSAVFLEPLNRYEASFLNRVGQAADIAREVNHPRVMALGDLFHMNIEEASLDQPFIEAGKMLGHVHIADNNRYEPGAGFMDLLPPFAALKSIGYDGWITIECWLPGGARLSGDPERVMPVTVRYLRDAWDAA